MNIKIIKLIIIIFYIFQLPYILAQDRVIKEVEKGA